MDFQKLLEIAGKLNVPGLVQEGLMFISKVKSNAAQAKDVLTEGEQADLDRVHAETIAVVDELDEKARAASGS